MVLADNLEDLQLLIDRINKKSREFSLKMNIQKTKIMVISKQRIDNAVITLDGGRIEMVPQFKYLGCWLNEDWDADPEIKIRIEIARGMFQRMKGLMCGRSPRFETRWHIVRCYVLSVLLYGVEGCTLKVSSMNRLEAFEMWMYCRMLRIPWVDRVTNNEVLRRAEKPQEVLTIVKRRKAAYFGHIFRNSNLLQLIIEGKLEGRRGIGRKQFSWMRNLR